MATLAGIKQDKRVGVLHRSHAATHRAIADQHEDMAASMPQNAVHHKAIARLHRQIAEHHESAAK
jgi:hypothetical protein